MEVGKKKDGGKTGYIPSEHFPTLSPPGLACALCQEVAGIIAVFTKVGHGTFSLVIIIIFLYFRTDLLDVQHLENLMDSLENHSVVVVERSTFEQR